MPVWSDVAIDYGAGFDVVDTPYGKCLSPRKIGCFVMTIKEAEECLKERRKEGDY